MADNNGDVEYMLTKTTLALREVAELLWIRQHHDSGTWEPRDEPFKGWAMRCERCGENLVVQFLGPRKPMALGLVVNMLPGRCGDRVYIPPRDEVILDVFL